MEVEVVIMRNPRKVLVIFAYLAIAVCMLLAMRYFYIQVIRSDHFQEKVAEQRVKEIIQLPERGKIVDRNENVMALSLMAQDINVYPNLIQSKAHQEKVAKLLSETLDMKYDSVLKVVEGSEYWASIAKRVEPEKVKLIKEAKIGGIEIQQSPKRYYPNGTIGAGLLGFVNQENEPGAGIELSMNSYLAGTPGYTIAETDNVGKVVPVGFENISNPIDGQTVKLATDNYMQFVLERRLEQAQKEMEPVSIHAVLMNPKNGEIYAMASTPTFDPNNYGEYEPSTWTNTPVSYVYEPGSTFKPIYMALALQGGHINENSTWYDGAGNISVQGTAIKNWDGRALGQMSLTDIIVNSSNVGMIEISKAMKSKEIVDGLSKAGFGKRTGIQFPGEEYGLFPSAEQLDQDPLMKATVSFGQGIAITPIQLVTAFSEVINGGHDVEPTMITEVEDVNGNILYKNEEKSAEQIYSKEVSDAMKSYLKANMEIGSGEAYQIDGYNGGGKTGSAWVVENGVYKKGVIIGSFLGFAPYDDPEFALLVVVNQPKNEEFGGPSAGPIYHDVMEEVLRYAAIPKDDLADGVEQQKEISYEVPTVKWMVYEDAKELLEKEIKGVKIVKAGKGPVVLEQEFHYKNNVLQITLQTKEIKDENFFYMPHLIGKTKAEVQSIMKAKDLKVKFHGEGNVVEQNLAPGRHNPKKEIVVWLKEED